MINSMRSIGAIVMAILFISIFTLMFREIYHDVKLERDSIYRIKVLGYGCNKEYYTNDYIETDKTVRFISNTKHTQFVINKSNNATVIIEKQH